MINYDTTNIPIHSLRNYHNLCYVCQSQHNVLCYKYDDFDINKIICEDQSCSIFEDSCEYFVYKCDQCKLNENDFCEKKICVKCNNHSMYAHYSSFIVCFGFNIYSDDNGYVMSFQRRFGDGILFHHVLRYICSEMDGFDIDFKRYFNDFDRSINYD